MESVSTTYGMGVDVEYTFCETCEQNIDRVYFYDDYDRLKQLEIILTILKEKETN